MTAAYRPLARLNRWCLFGLLAVAVVAIERAVVQRPDFAAHPALPAAVTFDLLVGLPALFYFAVVRRYRLPVGAVAGAFGAALAVGYWLLPAGQQQYLGWGSRLAGALEVLTLGYCAVQLRRVVRNYRQARRASPDFVDNLDNALRPVLGRLTEAVATEVAVLRYALLSWRRLPEIGPGEQAFGAGQTSGFSALLAALGGLGAVEAAAVHLALSRWQPGLAWLATALSLYGLLALLAHGRAVRLRPVVLSAHALVVRTGLGWRVRVPRAQLLAAQPLRGDVPPATEAVLNAAKLLLAPPNLLLTFAAPLAVVGPYGLRREVRHLAVCLDDPAALLQSLHGKPA